LRSGQSLFIAYSSASDRDRLRGLVSKLAELLGYRVGRWMTFLDVKITYDYYHGIADELTLHKAIADAIEENGIGTIDEFRFGGYGIELTVMVEDEEAGCRGMAAVIQNLFPDAPHRVNVPPREIPLHAEPGAAPDRGRM